MCEREDSIQKSKPFLHPGLFHGHGKSVVKNPACHINFTVVIVVDCWRQKNENWLSQIMLCIIPQHRDNVQKLLFWSGTMSWWQCIGKWWYWCDTSTTAFHFQKYLMKPFLVRCTEANHCLIVNWLVRWLINKPLWSSCSRLISDQCRQQSKSKSLWDGWSIS